MRYHEQVCLAQFEVDFVVKSESVSSLEGIDIQLSWFWSLTCAILVDFPTLLDTFTERSLAGEGVDSVLSESCRKLKESIWYLRIGLFSKEPSYLFTKVSIPKGYCYLQGHYMLAAVNSNVNEASLAFKAVFKVTSSFSRNKVHPIFSQLLEIVDPGFPAYNLLQ